MLWWWLWSWKRSSSNFDKIRTGIVNTGVRFARGVATTTIRLRDRLFNEVCLNRQEVVIFVPQHGFSRKRICPALIVTFLNKAIFRCFNPVFSRYGQWSLGPLLFQGTLFLLIEAHIVLFFSWSRDGHFLLSFNFYLISFDFRRNFGVKCGYCLRVIGNRINNLDYFLDFSFLFRNALRLILLQCWLTKIISYCLSLTQVLILKWYWFEFSEVIPVIFIQPSILTVSASAHETKTAWTTRVQTAVRHTTVSSALVNNRDLAKIGTAMERTRLAAAYGGTNVWFWFG